MKRALHTRAGFTLIELMIALAAGTIAVGAVYYLSGTANQTYSSQMRVSETQMGLRMAMEQVRRDFSRAGYLAAPAAQNTSDDGCSATQIFSTTPFEGLSVEPNGSVTSTVNNLVGSNSTRLDRVQLVGNFATSEDYRIDAAAGSNIMEFTSASTSFGRSFGTTQAQWEDPFESTFALGRLLRIEAKDGGRYFYRIMSSVGNAATPTVTLSQPPNSCLGSIIGSALVAPVVRIAYSVEPITTLSETDPAFKGLVSTLPGGQRMALVRRELTVDTQAIVPGSERVVLDYVTEFRVDAVADTSWGLFQNVSATSAPSIDTPGLAFRSAIVTLASRSADLDRKTLNNIGRINGTGPMATFQVGANPNDPEYGIARVRTMRSEIFLPNLLR